MKVKVFIHDGIVMDVLANGTVDVEIIDIDKDYEDYQALLQYEQEVRHDNELQTQAYHVAHFCSE